MEKNTWKIRNARNHFSSALTWRGTPKHDVQGLVHLDYCQTVSVRKTDVYNQCRFDLTAQMQAARSKLHCQWLSSAGKLDFLALLARLQLGLVQMQFETVPGLQHPGCAGASHCPDRLLSFFPFLSLLTPSGSSGACFLAHWTILASLLQLSLLQMRLRPLSTEHAGRTCVHSHLQALQKILAMDMIMC